ncbi:hypothetical protein JCM19037_3443 [Geomicrobium sp. JCM 19037]|uniref:hypothetical protein n=1 Tax=Geomicrobium sp. JCM 19037 TaxID=1460634 RepID=UPI00045F4634|nr:hypothetical protein [Geomicrobium sp. JCM 19037]GAK04982.1 hypothetical protein JCM19037_3443 [Geomicrobium sp. JCM 19037]
MNSWISYLLPKDEYKSTKVVHFLAEGGVILLISTISMLLLSQYFFTINLSIALFVPVAIFLFYVTGRYIVSGIEFTEVDSEDSYKRELKVASLKSISFAILYSLLSLLYLGFPNNINDLMNLSGLLVLVGMFWFLANFISLKRSYTKNKALQ